MERHKQWTLMQVDFAEQEGLYPEAERMKRLIRDCEAEQRTAHIQTEPQP